MIVCPNCNHQNPDGAIQCEACYTPLPAMLDCPACGASVQSDASFCGQCGANLATNASVAVGSSATASTPDLDESAVAGLSADLDHESMPDLDVPDIEVPDLVDPGDLDAAEPLTPDPISSTPDPVVAETGAVNQPAIVAPPVPEPSQWSEPEMEQGTISQEFGMQETASPQTQLQIQTVKLIHTQTNMPLELPQHLTVIHIGKPNDRVPPDIDVSGFHDSEVVSRVHADIRVEGDNYYLEDTGSSNGTYVNNVPLLPGNRHRLRAGDRIALGKGDKVSFIVQIT